MNLAELQRTMAAAVMQPLTADEEMRVTAPDGRAMSDVAGAFIAPNSQLSSFERLEIYNRQYWFRVLGALAEDFPGLRTVVGSRAFHALPVAYLAANPSRSFTLRNLGRKLPQWLAANPQYGARRHALAVDVARIEWAFVETFDLAEHDALTIDQIATLDGDSLLALQPHLQLVALTYPADDLVLSLHKREKRQASEAGLAQEDADQPPARLPHLRKRPTWLASHRVDNSVYYLRLTREEFTTLRALRQGLGLAGALAAGFTGSNVPDARRAKLVERWFTNWAELGWLCTPEPETLIRA